MQRLRPARMLAAAALLLAAACAREAAAPAAALAAEPALLDLGSVTKGERGNGVWRLRNVSGAPLTLSRIGPSGCQCALLDLVLTDRGGERRSVTDGQLLDLTLAPGERAELHLTLETARYREPISRKVGGIPVVFRDQPYLMLEWAADIWTPFAVSPWEIALGEVGLRERPRGRVLVSAHDEADFELDVDVVIEGWEVRSSRLSPEGEKALYEISVVAPAELPEGGFQKQFQFLTSLAGAPPVQFTVQGMARPDLTVSPARVLLDPEHGRREARIELRHRAVGGLVGDFQIEGLPAGLEAADLDADPAARRGFTLRWSGAPPAETVKGVLLLRTSDPERPLLELPFAILPARPAGP